MIMKVICFKRAEQYFLSKMLEIMDAAVVVVIAWVLWPINLCSFLNDKSIFI